MMMIKAAALLLSAVTLLSACGGSSEVPFPQPGGLRPLSADFSTRKAVNYSPYRTENRDTEIPTVANVKQDLDLLVRGGFGLIRMFNCSDKEGRLTLQVIRDFRMDIKVMIGTAIFSTQFLTNPNEIAAANQRTDAEMARCIVLANEFKDTIVAVSVGNETRSFNPLTEPRTLYGYINRIRAAVTQPVTTSEVFFAYDGTPPNTDRAMPDYMLNAIDFAAMHVYPILNTPSGDPYRWDWQQQDVAEDKRAEAMMDEAIRQVDLRYKSVRKFLNGRGMNEMPIVIGETGWKAVPTNNEFNRAHPVNQKMYYDRLMAWADKSKNEDVPTTVFYFQAFDEPFKGNDDGWGLFNVNRQARYVVQDLFPRNLFAWEVVDASICANPQACTLQDAVYADTVTQVVISADRYTIYADAITAGEQRAPVAQWFGFDSPPNAFAGEGSDAALAAEGLQFMEIGPAPSTAVGRDYGWGILTFDGVSANLSQFGTGTGRLNFSIKTTYPGKLMFGFSTGGVSVFVVASNTNADGYGFVNDGTWRQVSIPISAFTAAGNSFNLADVTNTLVIADIYDTTGNTARGDTTKVFVDSIFWSK